MADSQQRKQQRQAGKHKLQHFCGSQRAKEQKQREEAPQRQISAEEMAIGGGSQSHFWQQQNRHQRQPEAAVRGKGGQAEGVAFFILQQPGKDLRDAAVKEAHRQDNHIHFKQTGVV
ncbi:hypothetical protein COLO4_02496 [Corchorus olitorius]|uniref:Uncharacterized protein n=1 Tax=Corchorus olitorius TaxID=93759 RepID=A0A1R3L0V2_9ROSI|nr:hypothetical protein COLO4_02496 [Corchorus olitorius]